MNISSAYTSFVSTLSFKQSLTQMTYLVSINTEELLQTWVSEISELKNPSEAQLIDNVQKKTYVLHTRQV